MAPRPERRPSGDSREDLVQWLFAATRDPMLLADAAGRLALVNRAWAETVGSREAELAGRPFRDFLHPADALPEAAPGGVAEGELRLQLAGGGFGWFSARVQRLADDFHIITLRDAAATHARAEELAELRRTRDLLCRSAGIGMWRYEPSEGRVAWSELLLQRMGLASEDLSTADDFRRRLPPGDRRKVARALTEGVATGRPGQIEHRLEAADGQRTFRVTYHAEPRPDGRFALAGLAEDITELAAARDAARRGERRMRETRREALAGGRRLKLALEVAQAGVYEIDHVARSFWASPEFMRLAGARDAGYAAVTGLRYPRFHPDDLAHVRECFRALHHGERRSEEGFEARILDAGGEPRWVRIFHHLVVARNGRWLKAVGLLHDIDADKRQELALIEAQREAQAGAEAKAAFLANMSHEIRTPLNGVLGVLHLLGREEQLTADGRTLLEEALSCGQMLAELLDDIIDFSKIEAGCIELACAPVDPQALVEGVLRVLAPQAEGRGLWLRAEPSGRVAPVSADPVRLRQALFNLVGNAVKFTETGGVTVRFGVTEGRLRFEVEDTGVGIPDGAQAQVFERFHQGDASTTRRFGGSGLGLSITRKLARLMGGDVGFTSTWGAGSTFWLEVAAEPAQIEAPAAPTAADVLAGLRVLVVEDNATNRLIATKLLEQLGATVETAADGYLGVEAAGRGGFDLVLMDVQMPGIDGPEATRRIRALPSPVAATPIIALTANVLACQRQAYLEAGMDGVVAKPISPAALLAEIARLAAPAESEAEVQAVA